jgi:hypothetical protein
VKIKIVIALVLVATVAYGSRWDGGRWGSTSASSGSGTIPIDPPVTTWILEDGTWNDSGVWDDTATWNDGV